jgi:surface antigen
MPDPLIYKTDAALTRSAARSSGSLAVLLLVSGLLGGCAFPISVPLSPTAAISGSVADTGLVDAEIVDAGVADRLGTNAWAALKLALASAAERGEDGQTFAWKSQGSGDEWSMEGTVTAVDAFFDEGGAVCRRLAITAIAYQRTDVFSAEACRRDGGGWNVQPMTGDA